MTLSHMETPIGPNQSGRVPDIGINVDDKQTNKKPIPSIEPVSKSTDPVPVEISL